MKVPTRCALAVKHLWLACLILNIDKRHSTNSPVSNVVPVPLVSPPQGERWKGQWRRRSSGTRLGVEWVDPKDVVKNEEYDHSCSEGSTRCVSASKHLSTFDWHAIQSAWVQGLRNLSWHHKWQANTKQLLTKEDYNRSAPHVSLVKVQLT